MKDSTGKKQLIGSLTKGLIILEIMMQRDNVGVTEIAKALKINKSSAYRLLITLEERGFVKQDQISGKYSLGMKLAGFRTKILEGLDIRDIGRPFLVKLTEETKESAALSMLQKDRVVVVEKNLSREPISANLYVGLVEPLHCTALGKVLLAFQPAEKQQRLIASISLERFTSNTIVDPDKLTEELAGVRKKGYAIDDEEYSVGMRCLAGPVFNSKGDIIAAIGISGPVTRLTINVVDYYAEIIKQVSQEFSSNMGYAGTRTI